MVAVEMISRVREYQFNKTQTQSRTMLLCKRWGEGRAREELTRCVYFSHTCEVVRSPAKWMFKVRGEEQNKQPSHLTTKVL